MSADMHDLFGPPIYTYTRKDALADGFQIEVTETAREVGITFRTFINRTVWDGFVKVPPGVEAQDERGRLWDILWMLRTAIHAGRGGSEIAFGCYVRNTNRRPRLERFKATCGPVDIDDPAPAITIMLPDED